MKKTAIVALLGSISLPASADFLGFTVGVDNWNQSFEGYVQDGPDKVDMEDDLGYDDETGNSIYAHFEHPLPLLPNIRVQRSDIEVSGAAEGSFTFEGNAYVVNTNSNLDLSHTDATLYYEILDNVVSLDLGLTVRDFDGGFDVTDGTQKAELDINAAVPLLYGAVSVALPFTGLSGGGHINILGINDTSLSDTRASIKWESALGLGVEAGLRRMELTHDDDEEEVDLSIEGAFIGAFYHF